MACRVLLVVVALVCAAVAAYVVVQRETFLTGPKSTSFFLCLPLLVGTCALLATRLTVERKLKLLLALASTTLSLLFAELYLLAAESYRDLEQTRARLAAVEEAKRQFSNYDQRNIGQFFSDHWTEGTKLYPRIYQLSSRTVIVDDVRVFPTSSLSNQLIVECFADGRYKVYLSDEYGFANPRGLQSRHADVVLVGDSFTAGECVSPEEDIGARVRELHPATVNLGIGGAGPLWELANLVEYGLPLEPSYVFWLYYEGNDLADLVHEQSFPELTRYLDDDRTYLRRHKDAVDEQVSALQKTEIDALFHQKQSEKKALPRGAAILRALTLSRLRTKLGLHRDAASERARNVEVLASVIERARTLVEGQGGIFVFVYVPDFTRFAGGSEDFDRELVVAAVTRTRTRWIDLLAELEQHPDALSLYPYRQPGHFNAAGYRFVAGRLLSEMKAD